VLGALVDERLSAGGFLDPDGKSSQVAGLLAAEHGAAKMQLIFAPGPRRCRRAIACGVACEFAAALDADDRVGTVTPLDRPDRRSRRAGGDDAAQEQHEQQEGDVDGSRRGARQDQRMKTPNPRSSVI